jgi:hypothetical protein
MTRSLAPLIWGLILVAIGVLFLAQELTNGAFDAGEFIGKAWPVLLIAIGGLLLLGAVRGRSERETVERWSTDVGGLQRAFVRIEFGAGSLFVAPGMVGKLVDGTFEGGVRADVRNGEVRLRHDMDSGGWWWAALKHRERERRVGLTSQIPVSLRVDGGASRNELDLAELTVPELDIRTGASESRIRLPHSGVTRARVDAGAASVRIVVPEGVAARVRGRLGLGSVHVDTRRFPESAGGWASPDFESAANRAEIEVSGGVGSLRVE